MSFNPAPNQTLVIDSTTCTVAEHPSAPGIPYGQEGRAAIVFQLMAEDGTKQALKVFKPRFVTPSMMTLAESLEPYASLPGMMVCRRTILTPRKHNTLLRQYPDLTYAALMPWVEGSTWQEIVASRQEFTPAQSLDIARSFLEILLTLEERGLAHCDLSGSNFLLEMNSGSPRIALVDVEGMYSPGLPRPEAVPGGSLGYAHPASVGGVWNPLADRFSGAVLLAEMLSLSSKEMRQQIYGETFFAPEEMQQDCPRFLSLMDHLKTTWGEETAQMFARAWHSETLGDCDSFGKWMVALPETAPALPETSHSVTTLQQERQFTADEVYLLIGWVSDSLTGKTGSLFQQAGRKAPDGFKTNLERLLTLTPTERGDATKKILAEFSTSPITVMTFQAGAPAVPAPAPIVQNPTLQNEPNSMIIYPAPNIPIEFLRIPAGEFLMGSLDTNPEAEENEKPQRRVMLD
jgi:serine/threonine protein kinase